MPNAVIEAQACGLPCIVADSITKEANVSGNVGYISLTESLQKWVNKIMANVNLKRLETKDMLKESGYDIDYTVKKFESFFD